MGATITEKDVADAQRLTMIFANLSNDDKTKAMVYVSALRDKEIADGAEKAKV